ncbi:transmembrane protein 100-like [Osmerus mordax]|uniref:transmembrane protein 100-like n=1 Tax=Osmerus mordax TaxID=8014 RepID=UPI0035108B27
MESLDPSALPGATTAVTYDPKSETVTLPGGIVSVTGLTMVTGGAELSCGSCMLAFGIWGTFIGVSAMAVGLWHQSMMSVGRNSNLLEMGLVVLAISCGVVGSVVALRYLTRRQRELRRAEREDGRVVLVGDSGISVLKKVTV